MPTIPVFVSSTFRDFHDERDLLREVVGPALDAELAPYGARVELLDLRWGVDTTKRADVERANRQVLDMCLDEIQRCRPLFLGLIGNRFGWTPQPSLATSAMARADVPAPPDSSPFPLSVTALEFWQGFLADPEGVDAVVALRTLRGSPPPAWIDEDSHQVDWLRNACREAARRGRDSASVFEYSANVARNGSIARSDLDLLARGLLHHLTPRMVERARLLADRDPDPYETAALMLREARAIVEGRDSLLERLRPAVAGEGRPALVLRGTSGVGKTTIALRLAAEMRDEGWRVASALIGAGPASTSTPDVISLLAKQLDVEVPAGLQRDDLLAFWHQALSDQPARTLVVLDGLDRLNPGPDHRDVAMLRTAGQFGARILVTTADEEQAAVLAHRGWTSVVVDDIQPRDVPAAAAGWAWLDGRRVIPDTALRALASAPRSGLWVRLAVSELAWLGGPELKEAERVTADPPAVALAALLTKRAGALPDEDLALAQKVLERAASRIGNRRRAAIFLGALALTRSGISAADLQRIAGIDDARTAAGARWVLAGLVVNRDATGRMAFDHHMLREAALKTYRSSRAGSLHALHQRLAEQLAPAAATPAPQRDATSVADRVFHALMAGEPEIVDRAVGEALEGPLGLQEVARVFVEAVIAGRETGRMPLAALVQFAETVETLLDPGWLDLLHEVLQRFGEASLTIQERQIIAEAQLALAEEYASAARSEIRDRNGRVIRFLNLPSREDGQYRLGVAFGDLEAVAEAVGDLDAAIGAALEARSAFEAVLAQDREHPNAESDLAVTLSSLAQLAVSAGEIQQAVGYAQEANQLLGKMSRTRPTNDLRRETAVALHLSGELLALTGDAAKSLADHSAGLNQMRLLYRHDPASPERVDDLAMSLAATAEAQLDAGQVLPARASAEEALSLRRSLNQREPGNARFALALARSLRDVARMADDFGEEPAAEQWLQESLAMLSQPELRRTDSAEVEYEKSIQLGILGRLILHRERPDEAEQYLRREFETVTRLVRLYPANASYASGLHRSHAHLGELAEDRGRGDEALEHYLAALEIARALAAADTHSVQAQREVAVALRLASRAASNIGQAGDALNWAEESLDLARHHAQANPSSVRAVRDLAVAHHALGSAQRAADRNDAALASHREARRNFERVHRMAGDSPEAAMELAQSMMVLAAAYAEVGDAQQAQRLQREAEGLGRATAAERESPGPDEKDEDATPALASPPRRRPVAPPAAGTGLKLETYRQARGSGLTPPDKASEAECAGVLLEIIGAEGPMLASLAYERYLEASGGAPMTPAAKRACNRALSRLIRSGQVHRIEDGISGVIRATVYAADSPPVVLRHLGPRRLTQVPPSEIQTLAIRLGAPHAGAQMQEEILRSYGLRTATRAERAFLDHCLDYRWSR